MLVNGDRLAEPNETFFVNLSNLNYGVIADGQGVGTILDDEPRISISDVAKAEGKKNQTTLFTFTVTLSAAYDQPVTMSYRTTDGTATTSDSDYVAKTGTLTFAPGETTKTITDRGQGRQQEGGRRVLLPGPVRQQQQLAVHQEPRHRHDPERRLIARIEEAAGGVLTAKQAPHRPGTAPALGLRAERAVVP